MRSPASSCDLRRIAGRPYDQEEIAKLRRVIQIARRKEPEIKRAERHR